MPVSGFPTHSQLGLELTLGTGWKSPGANGLAQGDTLVLRYLASQSSENSSWWSEDGTDNADQVYNRLKIRFGNAGLGSNLYRQLSMCQDTADYWSGIGSNGAAALGTDQPYNFLDLENHPTQTEYWYTGAVAWLDSVSVASEDVFSSMAIVPLDSLQFTISGTRVAHGEDGLTYDFGCVAPTATPSVTVVVENVSTADDVRVKSVTIGTGQQGSLSLGGTNEVAADTIIETTKNLVIDLDPDSSYSYYYMNEDIPVTIETTVGTYVLVFAFQHLISTNAGSFPEAIDLTCVSTRWSGSPFSQNDVVRMRRVSRESGVSPGYHYGVWWTEDGTNTPSNTTNRLRLEIRRFKSGVNGYHAVKIQPPNTAGSYWAYGVLVTESIYDWSSPVTAPLLTNAAYSFNSIMPANATGWNNAAGTGTAGGVHNLNANSGNGMLNTWTDITAVSDIFTVAVATPTTSLQVTHQGTVMSTGVGNYNLGGTLKASTSRTLKNSITVALENLDADQVLRIDNIELPAGFSANLSHVTLQPGESRDLTLTFNGTTEDLADGVNIRYAGEVVVQYEGSNAFVIPVSATAQHQPSSPQIVL